MTFLKNRPQGKKMGIILLILLIVISLAETIFRSVIIGEASLTTSNLGEQMAVIALAVTILILTAKGNERACYICYGAWLGYFVLDQMFELPGVIISGISLLANPTPEVSISLICFGWVFRTLSMIGIIAIGGLLVEYMCDGTIYNRAFNTLTIVTILLILGNTAIPTVSTIIWDYSVFFLDVFNCLYRLIMILLFVFFAYDSAKKQLSKVNFEK